MNKIIVDVLILFSDFTHVLLELSK